jgi:hypothetical protein
LAKIITWKNGFTYEFDNIVGSIITPVELESESDASKKIKVNAMWDTGANFTAINSKIVKELNLPCLGKAGVGGILGEQKIGNVYFLNIYLPNQDKHKIKVMGAEPKNCDILIGMDIISNGNFAISCFENKTTFTFCYPSFGKIDFYKQISDKVGRNGPCPCGSGRKYKHCCGK